MSLPHEVDSFESQGPGSKLPEMTRSRKPAVSAASLLSSAVGADEMGQIKMWLLGVSPRVPAHQRTLPRRARQKNFTLGCRHQPKLRAPVTGIDRGQNGEVRMLTGVKFVQNYPSALSVPVPAAVRCCAGLTRRPSATKPLSCPCP